MTLREKRVDKDVWFWIERGFWEHKRGNMEELGKKKTDKNVGKVCKNA
jgi:hypothetical protein